MIYRIRKGMGYRRMIYRIRKGMGYRRMSMCGVGISMHQALVFWDGEGSEQL